MSVLLSKQKGFTIVELLIVIVVIGILAAITIVAYNGIQDRAHSSSAQSGARNVATLLGAANAINSSYPNDLSTINNGSPIPTTDGTLYAYHVGSGNASYCVTVTNGTSSYKVTDTAPAPISGGCPGDGVGGVAPITNLMTNPSFETSTAGWSPSGSVIAEDSTWSSVGGESMRITASTNTTGAFSPTFPVTAGLPYSFSYAYNARTLSTSNQFIARFEWRDSNNASLGNGNWFYIGVGTGVSKGQNEIAPAGAAYGFLHYFSGGSTNTVDVSIDAVMVVQAASIGNYADGNSPNWIWNGIASNSTSTGPAQ